MLGALLQAHTLHLQLRLLWFAAASAAAHCCWLREQQWRVRKAILEIVILQGSLLFPFVEARLEYPLVVCHQISMTRCRIDYHALSRSHRSAFQRLKLKKPMIEGLKPRKIFWPAAQLQDLLASGGLKSVFAQMLRFMVNPLERK